MKRTLLSILLLLCSVASCVEAVPPQELPPPASVAESPPERVPLVVFAAGSLIVPFDALEAAFEERYPHIDVRPEYHGSIQVMRHATELHEPIDVVATADASLVPMLMYAVENPDTGTPYADWFIRFATNRMALACTPDSAFRDAIDESNWYEILSRREVRTGLSDPRFDPAGYRALMAFALAQEQLGRYTIFRDMFGDRFTAPVRIFVDENLTTITVPEVLETRSGTGLVMRGASIQLVALLQSGDLDYAFEYESVIRQHGLEMVPLPDVINLGSEELAETYARVEVRVDMRRFATVEPVFRGEPIEYAITVPSSAPHPEEASLFIAFLLGPEGRALMASHRHPIPDVVSADGYGQVPEALRPLCAPEGGAP